MTLINEKGKYFRITSFYASAFLSAKGMELVNIDRSTPKRSQFVFRDCSQRKTLMQSFNYAPDDSPEIMVDARKFVMAIKTLKEKLYQESF